MEDYRKELIYFWGKDGEKVIQECESVTPFNNSLELFLTHCPDYKGTPNEMLLSGIKNLFPSVWKAIPENTGENSWACICDVIILLGVRV